MIGHILTVVTGYCLIGVSIALADDAAPFPAIKQYSADMTTTSKVMTVTNKIFVDNGKIRSEMNMSGMKGPQGMPDMPGMQMVAIIRPDQQKMYEVMSAQKMVMVMPYDAAKERALAMTYTSGKFELVGPDTVDGQSCTKYKETIANQVFFMWMDPAKKFPIKTTSEDGSITVSFTNFHEGPQDPALFEPPSDYQVSQMPSMPGAPAPSAAGGNSTNGSPKDMQQITASLQSNDGMTAEAIIEKVKAAYATLQSYSDTGTAVVQGGDSSTTANFKIRLQRPGLYRIDWQGSPLGGGVVWSDGTGDFLRALGVTSEKQDSRSTALASATGISFGTAANIPDTFVADSCGVDVFRGDHQRQKDQTAGGVECYVILGVLQNNGETDSTTLWIGKKDCLIHRLDELMSAWPKEQPIEDSSMIAELKKRKEAVTPEAIADLKSKFIVAQRASMDMLKSGPNEFTESHIDIVTDKVFAPADFKP